MAIFYDELFDDIVGSLVNEAHGYRLFFAFFPALSLLLKCIVKLIFTHALKTLGCGLRLGLIWWLGCCKLDRGTDLMTDAARSILGEILAELDHFHLASHILRVAVERLLRGSLIEINQLFQRIFYHQLSIDAFLHPMYCLRDSPSALWVNSDVCVYPVSKMTEF